MTKIKVNVVIAGRTYPLSVENTDEEQGMRTAAKNINDLLVKFEQNYAVSDKQDVLAMCALQFASKLEIVSLTSDKENTEVINKINDLANLLEKHL
ncbi:cell division protein ZapA [Tenacibaculum finnmarkense]|uniref:cell division protein ZapA n=1 Tax=Tenacibaculum finnmarkense TaxID=2781243 RepID=UPI00187B4507|nr:cell division protein ZapA [Tenacibaculum finnmarkense]MBE7692434.1 cell division protein ZapA [Tenacibaculum finnmarkense genomovar finnmarkense]MCD8402596.1 cell division protein ZapA [Tenacibaculum finnmarkense genomovar finnmarkense]MCD8446929.1 cell division protein ZapA [Tenacibaculum finnmarkense genomovar finnmarkense]MCD8453957.1 cell division protein ZapA [Tenacibaculum finnmarkense genomovar ulcerans]MCG8894297.1 cell division protein ZapA [Tenacibaculum finnmarkense]